MERGQEQFPGPDPERKMNSADLERLGEELSEKLRSEMDEDFGRNFEAPAHLDSEDEKNRRAELGSEASELQNQLDEIAESISQATHQLASIPLTGEQTALLDKINALIAEREAATNTDEQRQLDSEIEATTKHLASLPVTPEQGTLLDDILGLIDEREKTELKLQEMLRNS